MPVAGYRKQREPSLQRWKAALLVLTVGATQRLQTP